MKKWTKKLPKHVVDVVVPAADAVSNVAAPPDAVSNVSTPVVSEPQTPVQPAVRPPQSPSSSTQRSPTSRRSPTFGRGADLMSPNGQIPSPFDSPGTAYFGSPDELTHAVPDSRTRRPDCTRNENAGNIMW